LSSAPLNIKPHQEVFSKHTVISFYELFVQIAGTSHRFGDSVFSSSMCIHSYHPPNVFNEYS